MDRETLRKEEGRESEFWQSFWFGMVGEAFLCWVSM